MVNIGNRIKAARQEKGISQEELAQAIGTTKSAVSRYEAGKRQPRYDQLQRVAQALGVSVHSLVDWDAVDKEVFKELFIYGEGPAGNPLVLSPEELAKLKDPPKEQIPTALDRQEAMEWGTQDARIAAFKTQLKKNDLHGAAKLMAGFSFKDMQAVVQELGEMITAFERGEGIVVDMGSSAANLTTTSLRRIFAALDKLNEEGQEKVATYAEDLVEMPKYQAPQPPQNAPESTPAPQEGRDTIPPPDASETPSEGRTQYVTLICPICGRHFLAPNDKRENRVCLDCRHKYRDTPSKK